MRNIQEHPARVALPLKTPWPGDRLAGGAYGLISYGNTLFTQLHGPGNSLREVVKLMNPAQRTRQAMKLVLAREEGQIFVIALPRKITAGQLHFSAEIGRRPRG